MTRWAKKVSSKEPLPSIPGLKWFAKTGNV